MARLAFPLMLHTVNPSMASAEGNTCRTSVRFFHRAFLAMRYQTSKGPPRSPCSFAASRSFFRLITCMAGLLSIRFADREFVKRNFALCELDGLRMADGSETGSGGHTGLYTSEAQPRNEMHWRREKSTAPLNLRVNRNGCATKRKGVREGRP